MIDTAQELKSLVHRARRLHSVALDTEFVWERTYYPQLGIVQVALSPEECFLVDAVALEDLSPLGDLLADPGVVKILHDAQQDLTILCRVTGAGARNVFDTRIAAGFAGLSATTSLRDLLVQVVGVELEKGETRTNWLHRPLSPRQVDYAIDDVRYLQGARQALLARGDERGLTAWLDEELIPLDDASLYEENDPHTYFQRIKTNRPLAPRDLAVLRELGAWRESEAQRRDRPRSHIVADKALVSLARRKPRNMRALKSVNSLSSRGIERYGKALLEQVERGLEVDEAQWPPPLLFPADKKHLDERADEFWKHIEARGGECGLDPGLVASRSEIKDLICAGENGDHRLLRGWRRQLLGEDFLRELAQQPAMCMRRRPSNSRRRRTSNRKTHGPAQD